MTFCPEKKFNPLTPPSKDGPGQTPAAALAAAASSESLVPVLELRDVSKSFGSHRVLSGLELKLYKGEIISLLGVSGSGKTTIFNLIAGLIEADGGQILLRGRDIGGQSGNVAYMLQKDLLLRHLSVLDNVCLPLLVKGINRSTARAQAAPLFPLFGLAGYEKKYPAQLSGGMAQRAAFLRTYLFSQDVALLDEPFSALDAITKAQLHDWYLGIMQGLNLSTIFITHDVDEAIKLSDRICILDPQEGKIENEISIDPQFRRHKGFYLQPEFLEYKKQVLEFLS